MITGIAIFAHGSAVESANEAVRGVVRQFADSGEFELVEPSFLELGQPNLGGAVARLIERGAGRVVVVPYFLTLGKHLQRDLPKLVDEQRALHPGIEFHITPPLDGHPSLAAILVDRARAALSCPMQAVLESYRELAPGVRHFNFAVPSVERLDFAAGQFVSLSHDINGKHITRAYSISSAPRGDNRFSLCLNLVPDGLFSPFLFAMQPGGAVAMQGPLGTFTIRDPRREMIWVATGTGIAPFRGMLDAWLALPRAGRGAVTLVFGARYPETLLYRDDFAAAAAAHPDFTFIPTLSRPPESWPGARGHVQSHAIAAIGERRDVQVYICGLKAMVDDLRAQLKALGFDRRQVVYEKFD